MTHPAYPDRQTLHREAIADSLLAAQAASTARLVEAVKAFQVFVKLLPLPFGSPIVGYDIKDVLGHLDDWTKVEPAGEDAAMELARDAA